MGQFRPALHARIDYFLRIGTTQTQHQSFNGFTLTILGHHTISGSAALSVQCHIATSTGFAAGLLFDNITHILQVFKATSALSSSRFIASLRRPAPSLRYWSCQCLLHTFHAELARCQGGCESTTTSKLRASPPRE